MSHPCANQFHMNARVSWKMDYESNQICLDNAEKFITSCEEKGEYPARSYKAVGEVIDESEAPLSEQERAALVLSRLTSLSGISVDHFQRAAEALAYNGGGCPRALLQLAQTSRCVKMTFRLHECFVMQPDLSESVETKIREIEASSRKESRKDTE